MRITIHIDSATTSQVRELLAAVASVGKHESTTVGVEGPECWCATTAHLTPSQFAEVSARLVKMNSQKYADYKATQ